MDPSLQSRFSALVIDPEPPAELVASEGMPLIFARDGKQAQSAILDSGSRLSAIFIDPIFTCPGGIRLIALAHRHRPATPIYSLHQAGSAPPLLRERASAHRSD